MLFYSTHLLSCCGEILKEDKWHILTYAGIHEVCIYTGGKKKKEISRYQESKKQKTKNPYKTKNE